MVDDDNPTDVRNTTPIEGRTPEETPTIVLPPPDPRDGSALAPGLVVNGRYRITSLIGKGGMGAVYRADDLVLRQPVALKFISGQPSARAIERLTDEVRIGRRITHPNVCRLHDIVEWEGRRFLVMEFVEGEDLSSLLARMGRLPHKTAERVAHDLAAGLAAAHAEGIVHRDLKPGNVMIDGRGRARITDFGLAIAVADAGEHAEVAGTPAYMAPEQLRGDVVDARADIYAFGLILVELFTAQRLNEGRRVAEIAREPAKVPASLTTWTPQIDPAVERFVLRALDPDPAKRPRSARELLPLLPEADPLRAAVQAGETPTPEMVAAAARSGNLSRANATALALVIVVGLLTLAGMTGRSRLYTLARVPPETLEARAREVVERLTPGLNREASRWWFEPDMDLIRSQSYRATRSPDEIAALDPRLVRFVYRQGNAPLVAERVTETVTGLYILRGGKVTLDDPPLGPGMATLILDRNGRLLRADAMDEKGQRLAEPGVEPAMEVPRQRSRLARLSDVAELALMLGSFLVAIVIALRNRSRGRADEKGAMRLAVYAFWSLMLSWVFLCDHVAEARSEGRLFAVGFGSAVSAAVILWFFYLALEPYVRRRFPEALVSWSRLLNGRLRDSLVARDLLLGIGGGILGRLLLDVANIAPAFWGGHPRLTLSLEPIGPFVKTAGNALVLQVGSIEIAIGALFLLVFLQRVLGRTMPALVAVFALFAVASLTSPALFAYVVLLLVLLLRVGLLAVAATNFVTGVLTHMSLTLDPEAWFFGRSLTMIALMTACVCTLGYLTAKGPNVSASVPGAAGR